MISGYNNDHLIDEFMSYVRFLDSDMFTPSDEDYTTFKDLKKEILRRMEHQSSSGRLCTCDETVRSI